MARKIQSRLKINSRLVSETPLHVGGYGNSPDTDLPLAQNGRGDWYVPGTSIAGVLRNWVRSRFGKTIVENIFGFQDGDNGHASFILIEDATLDNSKEILPEIRDGVGIDRFYGVAADKAKYDRAILPRGTRLNLEMRVEIGEQHDENQIKSVVGYLLQALKNEQIRFGASKTRGLGRVKLESIDIKEQKFIGFEILSALNKGGKSLTIEDLKNDSVRPYASEKLEIKISWNPRLPVMIKAGYDGIGVDILPLVSGNGEDKVSLCLPGSSIKGVFRSHAERIMRTLLDYSSAMGKEFHDQLDSIPLVEELFGARNKSKDEFTNKSKHLGLGALAIDDCYAKKQMERDIWQRVERATADPLLSSENWELRNLIDPVLKHPDCISSSRYEISHHVSIDRWTGGASDGALFSVLAPHGVEWEEMRLTLDLKRIPENKRLACVSLLLFVLRDLAQDRIPLGFATNRGMGEIEVTGASFDVEISDDVLSQLVKVALQGKIINMPDELRNELEKNWTETLEQCRA
jgi:CRISPR/Cas system CSM-associated protein Csm3 (group 7 of RAMP superfamily)